MIRIQDIMHLERVYGNITIEKLIEKIKGNKIYPCPQCECSGTTITKTYKPYPSGFPDSGWVDGSWEEKTVACPLCLGFGYNDKDYKPKMIQEGWE